MIIVRKLVIVGTRLGVSFFMETLNLMSKSNRFYHELTREYDLKALDAITLNYLINAFKKSVSHGEHGCKGKCFYRHDKKVTGFYWATTLAKLQNDIPCHIGSITTLESSLGRLQHKYGFIYKHQTIRTSKNGIQIFIPLLDLAVRIATGDYSYQTIINCKDGKHVKNCMIEVLKSNRSFYQKLLYRYNKNCKNNNHHIINHHLKNYHISNVVGSSLKRAEPKTNNNNHQTKGKSKNNKLPKWIKDIIFDVNREYDYKSISKSDFFNIDGKNPYIASGTLDKCLNDPMSKDDPKQALKFDYEDYINDNSDLPLKSETTKPNGYKPINQKLPKWARDDYKVKLHPTGSKLKKKIKKQFHDLDTPKHAKNNKPKDNDNNEVSGNNIPNDDPKINPFADKPSKPTKDNSNKNTKGKSQDGSHKQNKGNDDGFYSILNKNKSDNEKSINDYKAKIKKDVSNPETEKSIKTVAQSLGITYDQEKQKYIKNQLDYFMKRNNIDIKPDKHNIATGLTV